MSFDDVRAVTTAGDLRAFAHPLRLRLIEALELHGPLTATEAAARTGTTPSNASFHLRLLARHGYVEEAPGGTGRRRPWRRVEQTLDVDAQSLDADGRTQLRSLLELVLARHRDTVLAWEHERDTYDPAWRAAAGELHTVLHLTAEELVAVNEALHDALRPYLDGGRRPGALPVSVLLSTLPLPGSGAPAVDPTDGVPTDDPSDAPTPRSPR